MWSRLVWALWAWVLTAAVILISLFLPKGWVRDMWLVLPMVSGLFAMIMSFLGFAEVSSELIGRVAAPEPRPQAQSRPQQGEPHRGRRRAA